MANNERRAADVQSAAFRLSAVPQPAHPSRFYHFYQVVHHPFARRARIQSIMAKILIIEDEPQIVRTLRLYLEQAGYTTAAIYDGAQAIPAFRQERPDLILLDLNLPGQDGIDPLAAR